MVTIYAALGLFEELDPLNPHVPDPKRGWVLSRMVPFAGRMVTEKLQCLTSTRPGRSAGMSMAQYVRIMVDDEVQPLKFCGAAENGLCELSVFVTSQAYARADGEGDFEKCFH